MKRVGNEIGRDAKHPRHNNHGEDSTAIVRDPTHEKTATDLLNWTSDESGYVCASTCPFRSNVRTELRWKSSRNVKNLNSRWILEAPAADEPPEPSELPSTVDEDWFSTAKQPLPPMRAPQAPSLMDIDEEPAATVVSPPATPDGMNTNTSTQAGVTLHNEWRAVASPSRGHDLTDTLTANFLLESGLVTNELTTSHNQLMDTSLQLFQCSS
ncbi:hypothetical protein C8R45DRAFT_1071300 [Mycena sanguinolenta]|nr:hypothetical protein C8R45DRAFT_1071300 [Mycena sanguinolenta]